MKFKILTAFVILITVISCNAQLPVSKFNLDFEQNLRADRLPKGWFKWGNYELHKDSAIVHSGSYSSVIISDQEGSSFGSIAYKIPANYTGRTITLQGYMKTENVKNGFAGLLLRIDGNGKTLEFDNMQGQRIIGSNDWKKYSITLKYPENAENIYTAGILTGQGKAWFDDFTITIDGQNIQSLKETAKPVFKAQLDKEFEKGSKFHLEHVSQEQIEKLYKLCKIWGFLKYYHPETAKGNINWDYELFRVLPMINAADFDKNLIKWIKAPGPVKHAEIKKDLPNIKIRPDTEWLSDSSFLSSGLSRLLIEIAASEKEKTHYYIGFAPNVGNPVFKNENPYPGMHWNDTGYRLLALFRYWNMIEYFFPYKYLTDKDWDDVLREYIPKMVSSDNELSYKLTILTLIGQVQDTHANIWQQDSTLDQFYGKNIAPIEVKIIEKKVVVTRTFEQLNSSSKIKIGDIITHINNIAAEKVIKDKIRFCPASNYPTQLRDVSRRLLRTNENTLELTVENPSGAYTETINTVNTGKINFYSTNVPSHKELENNIGYIYPGTLKKGEIDGIIRSFKKKKGIIIDLRCYPSDFIVFSLGKYLMPKPTEFVKFSFGSLEQPGLFLSSVPLKVGEIRSGLYKGKIIILVNEDTQSQAEYTAMALRVSPHAQVIGSTTAGADGNVSGIMLPGNIRTMISGLGIYYPDGSETQRVGIVPDIVVKPTVQGIRAGKDEVLLKAVELINQ